MTPNDLKPQTQLMQFIVGKWISKPIYVAAKLGIADMLAEGPKSIKELAQKSQSHETKHIFILIRFFSRFNSVLIPV